jgi:hypothetical protein
MGAGATVGSALLLSAPQLLAQAVAEPQADVGASSPDGEGLTDQRERLRWRGTTLRWSQSLTTETVGLGRDVQTSNPTWDLSYTLRPRYYVYSHARLVVSVRAEVGVTRELTNSDVTTERGEWSPTDALLYGAYGLLLHAVGEVGPTPDPPHDLLSGDGPTTLTMLGIRAPVLTFPTSTVSRHNGTQLGLGVLVALVQTFPLLGPRSAVLPAGDVQVAIGYSHVFSEATEPTASGLERVRMSPDGTSVVSDQLGGAALAEHQLTLSFGSTLGISRRVSWTNTLGWRPSWKYPFSDQQEVCGVIDTGCAVIDTLEDRRTFAVVTQFASEVGVRVLDVLGCSFGYTNVTLQLGPDGTRRNVLYSPDSRFLLGMSMHLDELYRTAAGRRR